MYWFVHEQTDDEADGVLLDKLRFILLKLTIPVLKKLEKWVSWPVSAKVTLYDGQHFLYHFVVPCVILQAISQESP